MPRPNNTPEVIDGASNMRLLEELEQIQARVDEEEALLAQARARCAAADSHCVRMQIERWKTETQLAQACNDKCIGTDELTKAWDNKYAADQRVEQASQDKAAALAALEQVTSAWEQIASRLVQLKNTIESLWDVVHTQIELVRHEHVQPQEEPAMEHNHHEANEIKENQPEIQADAALAGDLPSNHTH